jgi:hypothetical protein
LQIASPTSSALRRARGENIKGRRRTDREERETSGTGTVYSHDPPSGAKAAAFQADSIMNFQSDFITIFANFNKKKKFPHSPPFFEYPSAERSIT